MTLIKSISGIRGTIGGTQGDNLTPIDIVKFATAYVRFMSEKHNGKRLTIVVGRDARISGHNRGHADGLRRRRDKRRIVHHPGYRDGRDNA